MPILKISKAESIRYPSCGELLLHERYPVGGAERQDGIVEVVIRIVYRRVVLAFACADADVSAGALLQHEGEIFRTHHGLDAGIDLLAADQTRGGSYCGGCLVYRIDDTGVAMPVVEFYPGPARLRNAGAHLAHHGFDPVLDGRVERAHSAAQHDVFRDHIPGIAAVDLRDADHCRFGRGNTAADDGLQRIDE